MKSEIMKQMNKKAEIEVNFLMFKHNNIDNSVK